MWPRGPRRRLLVRLAGASDRRASRAWPARQRLPAPHAVAGVQGQCQPIRTSTASCSTAAPGRRPFQPRRPYRPGRSRRPEQPVSRNGHRGLHQLQEPQWRHLGPRRDGHLFKDLKLADNAIGYTHASGNFGRSAFTSTGDRLAVRRRKRQYRQPRRRRRKSPTAAACRSPNSRISRSAATNSTIICITWTTSPS